MPKITRPETISVIDRLIASGYIPAIDASRMLGVHPITIYRWIDNGEVKGLKAFGRHYLVKTSLARKVGPKLAVLAGIISEAEAAAL